VPTILILQYNLRNQLQN